MELAFYFADQWTVDDIYDWIEEGTMAQTSNGVLFHSGYYIPDYLFDKKPTAGLYTTWYEEDFRNTTALHNAETGDITIYAPYESWTGPKNSKYLAEYWNLSFVYNYTDSEPKYAAKIRDLYAAGEDFIAFLYTPNFANFDINMETVKFPFNPSGTAHDQCRKENWCELADVYIQNTWSETEKLNLWPEVREFMMRYYMDRATVEKIMGDAYSGRYEHGEKFVWNAVCRWLRDESNTEQWTSWIPEIKRDYCVDGKCDKTGNATLQFTIFLLCGIVGFVLIAFVAFKISKLCFQFQRQFVDAKGLNEMQRLKRDQKRKTMIILFQRMATLFIGLADVITDAVSMTFIVFSLSENTYSAAFVWIYFSIWVIASIVSATHIFVTSKNIMEAVNELKYGIEKKDVQKRRDSQLAKLLFAQNEIERKIKGTLADIFVGVFEDLPFFVLNVFAILTSMEIEPVILFSTFVTTCNIGYKLSMIKQFFTHLQDKQAIKEQIGATDKKSIVSVMPLVNEQSNEIAQDQDLLIEK